MPKLAANLTMMFTEVPLLDRFAASADAGFKAVEVLRLYDHEPEVIAEHLQKNNLKMAIFAIGPASICKIRRCCRPNSG